MAKEPIEKWEEKIKDLRKKCKDALGVSGSIRYVGVINKYGRTLTGIMRSDISPLLKPGRVKDEFFIVSVMNGLRKTAAPDIGRLDHMVFYHKKVTIAVTYKGDTAFYFSIDKSEKNVEEIVGKIKKII